MITFIPIAKLISKTETIEEGSFSYHLLFDNAFDPSSFSNIKPGANVVLICHLFNLPKFKLGNTNVEGLFSENRFPRPNNLQLTHAVVQKVQNDGLVVTCGVNFTNFTPVFDIYIQ